MNNMNLISEGRPVIFPYNPSDNGEIVFERWKTRIKFFHKKHPSIEKGTEELEEEFNKFFNTKDREVLSIKLNTFLEGVYDKLILAVIYKERVE